MFGQLFIKECRQTARSLIYWVVVLILVFNFTSQLGDMEIEKKPEPGQEEYGIKPSHDPELIMKTVLGELTEEYYRESYTTYPIGFYKKVTLNEKDDKKIEEILKEAAGIDGRDDAGQLIEDWYTRQQETEEKELRGMYQEPLKVEPADSLTYERFGELMDEADKILGGGSGYAEEYRENSASEIMTYEDAAEAYNTLTEKDRLSGGYARLFSDYMVIFLGILPVFLAVTRGLRDRRAMMQELIYTRRCSSFTVVTSRYLSMIVMLVIPVLIISLVPLSKCIEYARTAGISIDMLAFVKYTFGWLVPTIMIVTAAGMLLTELTDTAAAVLVQGVWWFITIFGGIGRISGGMYGWSLAPRHNTEMNWQGFHDGFGQLAANRLFYTAAALLLVFLSVLVYSQKRKGRFKVRGKILADRKDKSKE